MTDFVPTVISGTITVGNVVEADPAAAGNATTSGGITYAWGYGGSITESDGTFTITPYDNEDDVHYVIDTVVVDGVALDVGDGTQAITVEDAASSVFATFAYTVNFQNPANGTLSVSRGGEPLTSGSIVRGGEVLTITATPDAGFKEAEPCLTLAGLEATGTGNEYRVIAQNGEKTPAIEANFIPNDLVAPTIGISGGVILANTEVPITHSDSDAVIYYTTDGTTPTAANGEQYTSPVPVTQAMTLRAVAVQNGYTSPVASEEYSVYTVTSFAQDTQLISFEPVKALAEGTVAVYDGKNMVMSGNKWLHLSEAAVDVDGAAAKISTASGTAVDLSTYPAYDVNADGVTNILDAQAAYELSENRYTGGFDEIRWLLADTDGSESVTADDARNIQSYVHDNADGGVTGGTGSAVFTLSGAESVDKGSNYELTVNMPEGVAAGQMLVKFDRDYFTYEGYTGVLGSGNVKITRVGTDAVMLSFFGSSDTSADQTLAVLNFTANAETVKDALFTLTGGVAAGTTGTVGDDTLTVRVDPLAADLRITNLQELKAFAAAVNDGDSFEGKVVALDADITIAAGWEPIGSDYYNPFKGTFDGQGHTITVAYTDTTTLSSLFGYIDTGAVIQDVVTDASTVSVGPPLLYSTKGSGTITIRGCVNYANVVGYWISSTTNYAGGIAYSATNADFIDCLNYGDVTCEDDAEAGGYHGKAGGIAYEARSMLRCGNYGDVYAGWAGQRPTPSALGYAQTVTECFNKGNLITGGTNQALNVAINCETSVDSYNTGSVTVLGEGMMDKSPTYNNWVGGFSGSVTNCYSVGSYTYPGIDTSNEQYKVKCGAFVDYADYVSDPKNSYDGSKPFTSSDLNAGRSGDEAKWQDDVNNINGGYPLLWWEANSVSDEEYNITFKTTPSNATVKVYRDAEMTDEVTASNGKFALKEGVYFYEVSAENYQTVTASFNVRKSATVTVTLKPVVQVTFKLDPSDATITVRDTSGDVVEPVSETTYELLLNYDYTYTVERDGYITVEHGYTAERSETVEVTLEKSDFTTDTDQYIYGHLNTDKKNVIDAGGTYYIAPEAEGVITISTSADVTLVGRGISTSAMYEYVFIDYTVSNAHLTIKDLFIHNDMNGDYMTDLMDFTGDGNYLYFSGDNCLEWDGNASGYAAIHVPSGVSLEIAGTTASDVLYLYKHEQGAAIGGHGGANQSGSGGTGLTPEWNGNITLGAGTYFIKGSKQGATIGAGAQASSTSGSAGAIRIEDGVELNGIQVSRGAFIGGSAGATGATTAGNVYISPGASININVDYSGAAIGGGGYALGNDKSGGKLYYSGGSVRTYVDYNAIVSDGVNLWEDYGITTCGVDARVINADIYDSTGDTLLYPCLFNTEALASEGGSTSKATTSSDYFTVVADEGTSAAKTIYTGGLHKYSYVNENLQKEDQRAISYTWDNWVRMNDPMLYLFLSGEDHTLTVNGVEFKATWDAATETFTITDSEGKVVGGSSTDSTETVSEGLVQDTTVEDGKATVTVDDEALSEAAKDAGSNTQFVLSGEYDEDEDVSSVTTQVGMDALTDVADSGASVKVETPLGDVTLSNEALRDITDESGKTVTVTIEDNDDDSTTITVAVDGKAMDTIDGGLKVAVPAEDGQVVILVNEDGTGTVVPKSLVEDGVAYVLLEGSATIKVIDNAKDFTDVASDAWYTDAVDFASSHELFKGVTETTFAPNSPMTRAMLVTVLYRLESEPGMTAAAAFRDVPGDTWYTAGVAWASENGIVNGVSSSSFAPNDNVTREQIATILYRYMKALGYSTGTRGDLSKFSDGDKVSDWASDAMDWAVGIGLFQGNADGTLDPTGSATRAEVATLMQRVVALMVK